LLQAAVWHARLGSATPCGISVNVSARRLSEPGFAEIVIGELDAHGVPHPDLLIELTERILMEASHAAMSGLREVQAAGVQIGLDDFGTGYSSLAYLRQFPLDFVKIDKSFIRGVGGGEGEEAIVAAIVDLSHALELRVVAEGVETVEQQAFLTDVGCDEAQGYLFARPDAPGAFDQLVRNASR
jgi:EAL domain-containing protein (putative c-di-GMP-specific phosphodiesterase class I)